MSPFHRGFVSDDCSTGVPPSGFNGKVVVVVLKKNDTKINFGWSCHIFPKINQEEGHFGLQAIISLPWFGKGISVC